MESGRLILRVLLALAWLLLSGGAGVFWILGGWVPQQLILAAWAIGATLLFLPTRALSRNKSVLGILSLLVLILLALLLLGPLGNAFFATGWILAGILIVSTTIVALRDLVRAAPRPVQNAA